MIIKKDILFCIVDSNEDIEILGALEDIDTNTLKSEYRNYLQSINKKFHTIYYLQDFLNNKELIFYPELPRWDYGEDWEYFFGDT